MKKLSVMLCLIALLAFTLNGCGGSGTTDTGYYGGGDSGGSTTTAPSVTSCTTNLTPGQTCTIGGTGFGGSRDSGQSTVSFVPQVTGGTTITAATYLSWSDTVITLITPGITTGIQYVAVVNRYTSSGYLYSSTTYVAGVNGTTGTAATTAPAIVSQAPNPATAGASVTLTGTNFPTTGGWLTLNGTVVSATFTSTTAVFTVPTGTATGASVILGGGTGGSSNTFSLVIGGGGTTPTITSVTPNPVALGGTLTISGTNFGTTAGTVTVGSVALTSLTWGATQVTGTVPATGLTQGQTYTVTLSTSSAQTATGSVRISNPAVDPTITGITPTTIYQGTATNITIAGSNFGTTAGTVTINTSPATTLTQVSWGATSVVATVPATVAASTYVLTLTTSGGVAATGSITVQSGGSTASWRGANTMDNVFGGSAGGGAASIYDPRASNANDAVSVWLENATSGAGPVVAWSRRYNSTSTTWAGTAKQIASQTTPGAGPVAQLSADINSVGTIIATYVQTVPVVAPTGSVYWSIYSPATDTWTPNATALGTTPAADTSGSPSFAFSANGNGLCAFVNTVFGATQTVQTAFWSNLLQAWDPTQQPMDGGAFVGATGRANPQVAFDNNNNGLVVFQMQAATGFANIGILGRRYAYDATTPWAAGRFTPALGTPATLLTAALNTAGSRVNLSMNDSTGDAALSFITATPQAFAARFDQASTTWGAAVAIDNAIGQVSDTAPVCAFDSSGQIIAVFNENDTGVVRRVWANRRGAGSTGAWSGPSRIDDSVNGGGVCAIAGPTLGMNPAGTIAVCSFIQTSSVATGGVNHLKVNTYTTTGGWTGTGSSYMDANTGLLDVTYTPNIIINTNTQIVLLFRENLDVYFNQYR